MTKKYICIAHAINLIRKFDIILFSPPLPLELSKGLLSCGFRMLHKQQN